MSTTDEYVNLTLKRLLSQERLSEHFLVYLQGISRGAISRIFPESGLFSFPVTITPNYGSDIFTLTADPVEGIDDAGRVLVLTGADYLVDIPFENTATHRYWIGMNYITVPNGVYAHPRTGVPEYDKTEEQVGEKAEPDAVVDNGSTITFTVDSVCQLGIDHSSRIATVWLKNPISLDWSVAVENVAVVFSTPNNTITTSALLGQSTVSTNTADYYVAIKGVTIFNNAVAGANPFGDEYTILGYIDGGGPGSVSIADQRDLSGGGGHSIQHAYDGSGSGAGRTAVIDNEAINLRQENTSDYDKDIANAPLRIDKAIPTTIYPAGFNDEVCIDMKSHISDTGMQILRTPIADYALGDLLRVEEAVDLVAATDQVNFTRGGALDLALSGNYTQILTNRDMIEINGSLLGQDGLYFIKTVAATNLNVTKLSGAAVSFTVESGLTARLYRPNLILNNVDNSLQVTTITDFLKDEGGLGTEYQTGLTINVPKNPAVTDVMFSVYDITSSKHMFKVNSDGDIVADKDIDTLTGDIKSWAGDVIANVNVTATTGDVTASAGDVIANVDVTATTGDIEAVAGDLIAATNIRYGSAKQYYKAIPMSLGMSEYEDVTTWDYSPPANYWIHGSSVSQRVCFPIQLQNSSTILGVQAVVSVVNNSTITMTAFKTTTDYSTPAVDITPNSIGTDSDSTTGVRLLNITGLSETIDNTDTDYFIEIIGDEAVEIIHGIRVYFEIQTIVPN